MDNIFDDIKRAKQQILNDKHTLLEGYVTEQLFYNQFLKDSKVPNTNGWWMAKINGERFFFVVKEKLSDLDKEIIRIISTKDQCWHVILKDDEFEFVRNNKKISAQNFIKRYKLIKKRNVMVANRLSRNTERQKKAVEFFEDNNILKKIATERKFANNFLTVYFERMINIDFITKKKQPNKYN